MPFSRFSVPFAAAGLALTLALGGCASGGGGDQNYRMLEEDRAPLRDSGEPRGSAPRRDATHFVTIQQQPQRQQHGVTAAQPEADPSAVFDRRDWPTVFAGPSDGRTWHFPIYYRDRRFGVTYNDVLDQPTVEQRVDAALTGWDSSTFSPTNILGLGLEPVGFAIDTILLPVRAVMTPPWQRVSSPQRQLQYANGYVLLHEVEPDRSGWRGLLGITDLCPNPAPRADEAPATIDDDEQDAADDV